MNEVKTMLTGAGEVVLPVEFIKLSGRALRMPSGEPPLIRCEYIEEDLLMSLVESSPGHAPELGIKAKRSNVETARALLKYAPGLIGAGCVLVGPDGKEQRPAFHFGADPKDGSLPGRFLTTPEKLRLLMTVLTLSGYVGGAADSVRFHGGDGAGSGGGVGTVDAGEGVGDAPLGPDVREAEGEPDASNGGARG